GNGSGNGSGGDSAGSPSGSLADDPSLGPQVRRAVKELEGAERAMQDAAKDFNDRNFDGANGKEDDAIARLNEAQEHLRQALAMAREEGKEQTLAGLEARFKRMLEIQQPLTKHTAELNGYTAVRELSRGENQDLEEMAAKEQLLADEAQTALDIILEDGTS